MVEINNGKTPKITDYPLSEDEFFDLVQLCQDEFLINGFYIKRKPNRVVEFVDLHCMRVTFKGLEFLNKYSELLKTYSGKKCLKEWLQY